MLRVIAEHNTVERSDDLKAKVMSQVSEFTMLPAAALRAMNIAQNPMGALPDFVAAIEQDLKLTTEILGMANSPLFSTGVLSSHLSGAVMRLGFRQCQSIIIATCAAGFTKSLPIEDTRIRERLWAHGFVTGVICRHLNEELKLGFQGEEFTAGLLHDLGRSLVAATAPREFSFGDDMSFNEDPETPLREYTLWGTDHCDIGASFAEFGNLPKDLVSAIRYHHSPELTQDNDQLVATVAAADHVANHIERHGDSEPYDSDLNPYLTLFPDIDKAADSLAGAVHLMGSSFDEAERILASA